jgi:hypothetical protein
MSLVSIGIDYSGTEWKLCLLEDGHTTGCQRFVDEKDAIDWLFHICALYSELTLGFSSYLDCALSPLFALSSHELHSLFPSSDQHSLDHSLSDFLISLSSFSHHSYSLPSLKYLPTIPPHRLLLHPTMGTSTSLCSIATLLYRMRQSQAAWTEMRFLCLEIGPWTSTISVVQDGLVIDGLAPGIRKALDPAIHKRAFWEGLTYDLAGLMAVHHFEDIVISQQSGSAEAALCKEEVIQRLGDIYQFYLYPQDEPRLVGFESAIGAALLVSGFSQSGPTAELASRLLSVVS